MKVPLRDQITNYDCGPTSVLNGLSRLFERHEIPPVVMRHVTNCCMDWFDDEGKLGRRGTTHAAMGYVAGWLRQIGECGLMPLSCRYLTGEAVTLAPGSELRQALDRGASVVAFIDLDGWHYILITAAEGDKVYAWDPWRFYIFIKNSTKAAIDTALKEYDEIYTSDSVFKYVTGDVPETAWNYAELIWLIKLTKML